MTTILPPSDEKTRYVNRMFARIARRYDLMNRLMTGGRDRVWRQIVVQYARLPPGGWLLDVATGTGDIGHEALRQHPDARAVGADFTLEMMQVGQAKKPGSQLHFVGGDALCLPFADDTFDAAVSGFMMRNVADISRAFAEQHRVVKPGGRVVCLEISRPQTPVFRELFRFYFYRLVPVIGALVSGQREAYTYLPHSLTHFPEPKELAETMRSVGLRDVHFRRLMWGTVAIHVGVK